MFAPRSLCAAAAALCALCGAHGARRAAHARRRGLAQDRGRVLLGHEQHDPARGGALRPRFAHARARGTDVT